MASYDSFIGYHCDIARGAYLRPERFVETMQLAAKAGFTHFIPYLENMIALPSMEKAAPGCAYTEDDWRNFEAEAKAAGIDLVAHFNVIGHSAQICGEYPELAGPNGGHELDVTLPAVREWTERCLEEYCEFATSEWFLIGGDEWQTPAHRLSDPACDPGLEWAGQINLAVDVLRRHGRKAIVWHDMLMHYPQAFEALDKDAVIAFWFYDVDGGYPVIDTFKRHGFRVIMASGLSGGYVSERRAAAVRQGLREADRYRADGFMLTSWEKQRFEEQGFITEMIGRLVRQEELPETLIKAVSIHETFRGLRPDLPALKGLRDELGELLDDPAWVPYPEYQATLKAWVAGDQESDLASFVRYHAAEGPFYDFLKQKPARAKVGVTACDQAGLGTAIRVSHDQESFVLYPKYGPTLQDWLFGDLQLIPHSLPSFLSRGEVSPGGYRSYTAVGGFRPIWALGTHHNPCILWQHPWDWEVLDNGDRCTVRLWRVFPHADVEYRVSVQTGFPGFACQLRVTSHLAHAYCGFNWNLPLRFGLDDLPTARLSWEGDGEAHAIEMAKQYHSGFWIEQPGPLTFSNSRWSVTMTPGAGDAAGYFVDWGPAYITPDLHGAYRLVNEGETVQTQWQLRPAVG